VLQQIHKTFGSLTYFNYRMWFFGALVSNLGAWIQRVGQDWLVLRVLTNYNAVSESIVIALQFIPFIGLSAYAGVLADRLPRRKLLMATQAGQGILAFVLGIMILTGHVQLWHVYIFAFLLGCVTAIDGPVRQTFVAEMVPAPMLPNAVGLNSASFNLSRLLGPAIAGLLIARVGTDWTFIINGFTFTATILGLVLMRPSQLYPVPRAERRKGQIKEALDYVRGRRDLVTIFIVMAVISCLGLNSQLTISLMATKVFDRQADQFGLLSSIFAVGALIGALLAARRRHPRLRLILSAAFCFGIASLLSSIMPTYVTFGIVGILVGLCTLTLITAANSTIQMSTDQAMRGRVISLYLLIFQGVSAFGSPTIGWVAQIWSTRGSIAIGGIAALAVSIGALLWAHHNWGVIVRLDQVVPPRIVIEQPHEVAR